MVDFSRFTAPPADSPVLPAKSDPLSAIQSLDASTWERMAHYYHNPHLRPKGHTTFIPELDEVFKWMPGYANLFTGWPGSGKSEFVRQLLLLQAIFSQKKTVLFAPEDMPKDSLYDALIHSLTGQNPDPESYNPLPWAYYERAKDFIREYFYVVIPGKTHGKTPGHILDIFEAARAKLGAHHLVLDPFNKADHGGLSAAGGWQPYLIKELGGFTDWCVESQTCLTLIAHPAKKPRPRGEAREVPEGDGVSGGQTWEDMMHYIGAVYRPHIHQVKNDPAVAFYSHKIKSHRRMGAKPGSIGDGSENPDVSISFDWKTARYTFNGVTPLSDPAVQSIYAPDLAQRPTPSPPPAPARYDPHAGLPAPDPYAPRRF